MPKGGCVALLGPDGAGKTTVLRAITGLLPLHEGEITLDGAALRGCECFNSSRRDMPKR